MQGNPKTLLTGILVVLMAPWALADVSLPSVFGDHMVLQRGQENPIWGTAAPGEPVTVELAGTTRKTLAGEYGSWSLRLPSLAAGGPHRLTIQGWNRIEIEDVLVGDVWLASGQSNMEFSVAASNNAASILADSEEPRIRLFKVPKNSLLEPGAGIDATWKTCSAAAVSGFSAAAYLFGKKVHHDLGVPIGLIESSWGGTLAEEWASPEALLSDPDFAPILTRWNNAKPEIKQIFTGGAPVDLDLDDIRLESSDGRRPPILVDDFESGDRLNRLFGTWSPRVGDASGGVSVAAEPTGNRFAHFERNYRAGAGASLETRYSPGPYLNLSGYDRLTFRCRGKGYLKVQSLQPDVTDWDNFAAPPFALGPDWRSVTLRFDDFKQAGWGKARPFTAFRLAGVVFELLPSTDLPRPPSGLFNGMIHPLMPFGLKGVLWYQGEGNSGRAYQYRKLLPAMIGSWRNGWKAPELPFLVVQLPNYRKRVDEPSDSGWAELREAQLLTARQDPYVHVAVTIDLGEDDDVHPRNKTLVGERLAVLAEGRVYGRDLVVGGPLFRETVFEPGRIRIRFDGIGRGLAAAGGPPLRGFAVAGKDRRFVWAEARIEGDAVVVSSPRVADPVAVRYAWADNPDCNLYNLDGFPASPFRTDDWPGLTYRER